MLGGLGFGLVHHHERLSVEVLFVSGVEIVGSAQECMVVGLNEWVRVCFWPPVAEGSRRCRWSIGRDDQGDNSDIDCLFLHMSSSCIALFCCIYSRSSLSGWYTPGIQKIAVSLRLGCTLLSGQKTRKNNGKNK